MIKRWLVLLIFIIKLFRNGVDYYFDSAAAIGIEFIWINVSKCMCVCVCVWYAVDTV